MIDASAVYIIYLIIHSPDGLAEIGGQFAHENYQAAMMWCRNFVYQGIQDGIAFGMSCVDKGIWDAGGRPKFFLINPCATGNCMTS